MVVKPVNTDIKQNFSHFLRLKDSISRKKTPALLDMNDAIGYSTLKKMPIVPDIVNWVFTRFIKFDKQKSINDFSRNVSMLEYQDALQRVVESRMKRVSTNKSPSNKLAAETYNIINQTVSNVVLAKQALKKAESKRTPEEIELISLYQNLDLWAPVGSGLTLPVVKPGIRTLINLRDLYLMIAIHESVNPIIQAGSIQVVEPGECTQDVIEQLQASLRKNTRRKKVRNVLGHNLPSVFNYTQGTPCVATVIGNLRSKLAHGDLKKKTPQGETGIHACEAAIALAETYGNRIFHPMFLNYENFLKPFTQIAYQFNNGFTHHGIYLGGQTVVEVRNLEVNGKVAGFITLSHIFNFMKRATDNPSSVYMIEYENPLPDSVILARAMWGLGKFTNYHITNENCESFANWVFSNTFEARMCLILKTTGAVYPQGIRPLDELLASLPVYPTAPQTPPLLLENIPRPAPLPLENVPAPVRNAPPSTTGRSRLGIFSRRHPSTVVPFPPTAATTGRPKRGIFGSISGGRKTRRSKRR